MKGKTHKKGLSFLLCMVLMVAMTLTIGGCNGRRKQEDQKVQGGQETRQNQNGQDEEADGEKMTPQTEDNVLGEGSKVFALTVADQDGAETVFEIHTDQETVGDALVELELISGEEGEYGLYVKTVNGITADYDTDGVYWAFYINGEYASSGVDTTKITEGEQYSFRVEK